MTATVLLHEAAVKWLHSRPDSPSLSTLISQNPPGSPQHMCPVSCLSPCLFLSHIPAHVLDSGPFRQLSSHLESRWLGS